MTASIPQRLRAERVARGLSLDRLAARLDVNAVTIGSWEREDRHPPLRRVPHWAASLGLRLDLVPDVDPVDQERIRRLLGALSGLAGLEPQPGELAALLRACSPDHEHRALRADLPGGAS